MDTEELRECEEVRDQQPLYLSPNHSSFLWALITVARWILAAIMTWNRCKACCVLNLCAVDPSSRLGSSCPDLLQAAAWALELGRCGPGLDEAGCLVSDLSTVSWCEAAPAGVKSESSSCPACGCDDSWAQRLRVNSSRELCTPGQRASGPAAERHVSPVECWAQSPSLASDSGLLAQGSGEDGSGNVVPAMHVGHLA